MFWLVCLYVVVGPLLGKAQGATVVTSIVEHILQLVAIGILFITIKKPQACDPISTPNCVAKDVYTNQF